MKRGYKWILLGFLFVTFFVEQGTRQIYNAALPLVKGEFAGLGLSDAQFGSVGTVFGSVFGLGLVFAGFAADFLGRKRVLVFGTLLFSLGIFGCGFAQGLGLMMLCYGVMNALGQCCIAPPCFSLIGQHHTTTRATAVAIFQSASYVGPVICAVASGWLGGLGTGGWRWAFWLFGSLGVIWAIVMALGLRERQEEGWGSPSDKPERASLREAFGAFLGKPCAILLAFSFGLFVYTYLGLILWSPMFYVRRFPEMSAAAAAFHAVFWMNAGSCAGIFATGRLADIVAKRRFGVRLEIAVAGLVLCALSLVFVVRAETLVSLSAAMFALGMFRGVFDASYYPSMFDCIVPRYRSAVTGLTGSLAYVLGSFGPLVLGLMSDRLSLNAGFLSLSVFFGLAALLVGVARLFFYRRDFVGR